MRLKVAIILATSTFFIVSACRGPEGDYCTDLYCVQTCENEDCGETLMVAVEPTAENCESTKQILALMQRCRASANQGIGDPTACTDGMTSVPTRVEHLDEQIPLIAEATKQNCALAQSQNEGNQ